MMNYCTLVEGSGPNLIGRCWLHYMHVDWHSLGVAVIPESSKVLCDMLMKCMEFFQERLGTIRNL